MADPDHGPVRDAEDAAAAGSTASNRIDVGILLAHAPETDPVRLREFVSRLVEDVRSELESATDVGWRFFPAEPVRLADGGTRRPSEFLDQSSHRMVEGPYDVVVVVTDVPLRSSRERFVPGLASPVARTAVLSTSELASGVREEPRLSLSDPAVRWNGATLLLHLLGHVLGARHRDGDGVMAPFAFDPDRREVPTFDATVAGYLDRIAEREREQEVVSVGPFRQLAFHVRSVARNPGLVVRTLRQSKAPLLPFSLPKLSTAALAPTLVIVFSAESWDVGFHMGNVTASLFAVASVVGAAVYLLFAHDLSFPRRGHRVITEHTALVNATAFATLLLATLGLFTFVGGVILAIEVFVFPVNLMSTWPSLEDPAVDTVDLVRTAAFIATIGVLSGALAGGLESRTLVRHLALFLDRP